MSTFEKEADREKLLQEELDATKESLNTVLSHSPDGILIVDAVTDEILDANGQACDMVRTQKNMLLGAKSSEIFTTDWQSEYKDLLGRKLLKNGDYFQMSALVARPGGHRLPVELLAALVETNGIRRVQMILRDVSKERRIQGQLRSQASLLQNVNDAIISVDMNETVLFLNTKAESVYGLDAEDAICRSLYDVTKYEFLSFTHEQEFRHAIKENGFWRGEVIHYHKDGHPINIDTSVSVVKDDEGRPNCLVMVNRDITARKEAERKLERRGDEMTALYEIGQAISTLLNLKDALSIIHTQIARLMRARNFYIALYDAAKDEIYFPIYVDEMVCKDGTSRKAAKGYTEYVIQTGRPLLLGKETEEQMERDGYKGIGPQAMSWLGVPLRLRQRGIGMMAVQSYIRAGLYTEDDVRILSGCHCY
jgi:PAS domain S-box-containing protein